MMIIDVIFIPAGSKLRGWTARLGKRENRNWCMPVVTLNGWWNDLPPVSDSA